jgi:hypothetical protein
MKSKTDQMTDFSIFEHLRPTFHSIRCFYLSHSQTYDGNVNVKESYNAGRSTKVCELDFVSKSRMSKMKHLALWIWVSHKFQTIW